DGRGVKVAVAGRRRGHPFERVGLPRVPRRLGSLEHAVEEVEGEDQLPGPQQERADADELVHALEVADELVLVEPGVAPGMPPMPRMCMAKTVMLKNRNEPAKWIRPQVSFIDLPNILGNQ